MAEATCRLSVLKKRREKKENEGLKFIYVCIHRKPTLESPLCLRDFLILLSLFFFFLLLLFFIHSANKRKKAYDDQKGITHDVYYGLTVVCEWYTNRFIQK